MLANRLYHTWFEQIRQLLPDERITRVRNFAWLLVGIYRGKSVHLSDIASKIPGPSQRTQHCSASESASGQPSGAGTRMVRLCCQEPASGDGPERG